MTTLLSFVVIRDKFGSVGICTKGNYDHKYKLYHLLVHSSCKRRIHRATHVKKNMHKKFFMEFLVMCYHSEFRCTVYIVASEVNHERRDKRDSK
jgi:hypothetical protein